MSLDLFKHSFGFTKDTQYHKKLTKSGPKMAAFSTEFGGAEAGLDPVVFSSVPG